MNYLIGHRVGMLLVSCIVFPLLVQPTFGAPVTFTIDSSQSSLTGAGTFAGTAIQQQGPGSLTAHFSGSVVVNLDSAQNPTTIQITSMSLNPLVSGQWAPKPGGASGTADAALAGQVTLFFGTAQVALRGIAITASTPTALPVANHQFNSASLHFTVSAATADYNAGAAGSGSTSLTGATTTNNITLPGSITAAGSTATLTIPLAFQVSQDISGLPLVLNCTGTLVSTATVAGAVAPTITTAATLPAGTVGTAYNTTLAATGGTTPYTWTVALGNPPDGLTLSTAGVLSGTPTATGTANFTIRCTGADSQHADLAVSLTINAAATAPTITTASSLAAGTVGTAYNATLAATGGATPYNWTVASGNLPDGLGLSAAGVLSGTPTAPGTANFSIRCTGADTLFMEQDFQLVVNAAQPVNHPPLITAGPSVTNALLQVDTVFVVLANTLAVFTAGATDADGDTLSYHWAWGDGTTGDGPIPTHSFSNAQAYAVSVAVNDGHTNSIATLSVSVPSEIQVTALSSKLDFVKANNDAISFTVSGPPPPNFNAPGQKLTVALGDAVVTFNTVTVKGKALKATGPNGTCTGTLNTRTGLWTLKAALKKGAWQSQLAGIGMVKQVVPTPGSLLTAPVLILLGNESFMGEVHATYIASTRAGQAKKVK